MPKFVYVDNKQNPPKILFEVETQSISDADVKFTEATGIDASKTPSVGCRIYKGEKNASHD